MCECVHVCEGEGVCVSVCEGGSLSLSPSVISKESTKRSSSLTRARASWWKMGGRERERGREGWRKRERGRG